MFGIGDNQEEKNFSIYNKDNVPVSDEERNFSLYNAPKEPIAYGIPRGFVSGLRKGVGAVGSAMQAINPNEDKNWEGVGKAIETWGNANDVPPEQKGFWEKSSEALGMMAPIIATHFLAPGAAIPADIAFGSLYGLQQMHETEKAMKEKGLEPGIAPLLTGGATALTMFAAPYMLGKFLNGPIASVVAKDLAKETVGGIMKPTAGELIKKFVTQTVPMTEGIFLGQTAAVSGLEKAYGLPHDIPAELWETAKTAAGLSLMSGVIGAPVRRLIDNAHLKNLSQPLDMGTLDKLPEEERQTYAQKHAALRLGYVDAVGKILEHGDQAEVAKAWREYGLDKIQNNEPIDTTIPLDSLSVKIEKELGATARDLGVKDQFVTETEQIPEVQDEAPSLTNALEKQKAAVENHNLDLLREEPKKYNTFEGFKTAIEGRRDLTLPELKDLNTMPDKAAIDTAPVNALGFKEVRSKPTEYLDKLQLFDADGKFVGGIVTGLDNITGKPMVTERYVDPSYRRKGIGKYLVDQFPDVPFDPAMSGSAFKQTLAKYGKTLEDFYYESRGEKKPQETTTIPLETKAAETTQGEAKVPTFTPEQKTMMAEAKDAIFGFEKAKTGKKKIEAAISTIVANEPNITQEDLVKRYFQQKEIKAAREKTSTQEPGAENLETAVKRLGGINPEGKYSTKMLRQNATSGVVNAKTGLRPDAMAAQLKDEGWDFKDTDHLMDLLESREARNVKSPIKGEALLNREAGRVTNEWAEEKAKLASEGVDSGATAAYIGTATETFKRDLIAKGYSSADVDAVIEQLKSEHLVEEERKAIQGEVGAEKEDKLFEPIHDKNIDDIQKKVTDMQPEEKVDLAKQIDNSETRRQTEGIDIENLCNSQGKSGAFREE
jgi:GNAT superfamily N-acetyltransferase